MVRFLGIDFGKKRIGLAISDHGGTISAPATTLDSTGTVSDDVRRILRWAVENEVGVIVVGLPLNMDGSVGKQARIAALFAQQLRAAGGCPVELWDERLSSFQADEYLGLSDLSSGKRKQRRDAVAAHVILQSYLDSKKHVDEAWTEPPTE